MYTNFKSIFNKYLLMLLRRGPTRVTVGPGAQNFKNYKFVSTGRNELVIFKMLIGILFYINKT